MVLVVPLYLLLWRPGQVEADGAGKGGGMVVMVMVLVEMMELQLEMVMVLLLLCVFHSRASHSWTSEGIISPTY